MGGGVKPYPGWVRALIVIGLGALAWLPVIAVGLGILWTGKH